MRIGIPKEVKASEFRVALTPDGVAELVQHGHQVVIAASAGVGAGFTDAEYHNAGAHVLADNRAVYAQAELVVKVKEPQAEEYSLLRRGQQLFAYLHLAASPELAKVLQRAEVTALAFETITAKDGSLPLLSPMSQVAGRMATQVGAHYLERTAGGRGMLMGGVPGVAPAHVVVLGGGVAGTQAATMAVGLGAAVTILDKSNARLAELSAQFGNGVRTLSATRANIERSVLDADVVIGAVLLPGAHAPRLVTRAQVARMKRGAVMVDISIDQGGCFETSRVTTHENPTYKVDGIIHYCVANMPGAVPRTSTLALEAALLPYVMTLAEHGVDHPKLSGGLNVAGGVVVHPVVAEALAEIEAKTVHRAA